MNMYIGIFITNIKSLLLNNNIYIKNNKIHVNNNNKLYANNNNKMFVNNNNKTCYYHIKYIQEINKCIIFTRDNYLDNAKTKHSIFEIFNTLNKKKNKSIYLSPLFFFLNKYHNKKNGHDVINGSKYGSYEYLDKRMERSKYSLKHTDKKMLNTYDMIYFKKENMKTYTNINESKKKIRRKEKNMCVSKKGSSIYPQEYFDNSFPNLLYLFYYNMNKKKKEKKKLDINNYKLSTFFLIVYIR